MTAQGCYKSPELAERAGVSVWLVNKYVRLGIIPKPQGRTRGALYSDVHLNRLLQVRREMEKNVTLADLAERFG